MAKERCITKSVLSKHVLEMKFMKRSALRFEKEQTETEFQAIDDQHWVLDVPELSEKESRFQVEPSFALCEQLKFGRMSFRGFNPEIEKLMKAQDCESVLAAAEEREKEISVGDEEMTERFSSLVGTIGKKFSKKRKPSSDVEEENSNTASSKKEHLASKKTKRKFLKPS